MEKSMLIHDILDGMIKNLNISDLNVLSIPEFIQFVEECQLEMVKEYNLSNIQVRRLDVNMIESLLEKMKSGQGIQLILRHGEQDPGAGRFMSSYLDERRKKIIMMQKRHNESDPITIPSAIEFIGTLLTVNYLRAKTGYQVEVEHSSNLRAMQPAETLARALQITPTLSPVLTCPNYKEDDELDTMQLDQNGNLTITSKLDSVLLDPEGFKQNMHEMSARAEQPLKENTLEVLMTHTQQIDEFYARASKTGEPAGRLLNYGFIYRDANDTACYESGCYSKEAISLSLKPDVEEAARVSSSGFFGKSANEFANVGALRTGSLDFYLSQIDSFEKIWKQLHEQFSAQGLFVGEPPLSYNMEQFLTEYFKLPKPHLDKSAFQLLAQPISSEQPPAFSPLSDEIECYIDILCDVRKNKLSKKPYGENVDETQHADQAGKISAQLRMHSEDSVSLLFHDIARCAVEEANTKDRHAHHAEEGGRILAPLGITIDYSRYHAVAKYLLFHFCPAYKDLISPTSEESLKIQETDLVRELTELYKLEPLKLVSTLYQIMFMRLIDDMSKVPPSELKKSLGVDAEYFEERQIRMMLRKQMMMHLKQEVIDPDMEEKLHEALRLLLRGRIHSEHPELYEVKHRHVIEQLSPLAYSM